MTIFLLLALIFPLSCETIFNEATITGKVVNGETSQPLEGAFVRALGFSESVETDSDGSYELLLSIEDPEVDAVTLEISKTGFLPDTLQNIGLELGGTVKAPPSNLIPIATTSGQVIISGFARNGVTGEPVDSAFVTVFDHANATAFSNSAGNYVLKFNVDSDDSNSVTIQISKSTFLPDTVSNIGISFTDTIRVRDANLIPISDLEGDVAISGKVVNGLTAVPIEGALVRALKHSETAFSDSLGNYILSITLEAGESNVLSLEISKATFAPDTLSNIGVAVGDTVNAPPASLLPLALSKGLGGIRGSVFNGITEAPIEGAHVRALNHSESALTDSEGNYTFAVAIDNDESNVVSLEIIKSGFFASTLSNLELSIGDTVEVPPANLLPIDPEGSKAIVKGVVVDDVFFDPIEGAQIRAIGHDETTLTSELGNFSLSIAIKTGESNVVDLIFSQEDFVTDTLLNVTLTVDSTITLANQELTPANRAGPPSNATVINVTRTSISIQGAGGEEESSEITYRLQDVNGITLDRFRPTEVSFSFFGPGGGEFLSPLAATTDAEGLVRTALNSGTIAGVVQVIATFDPGTGVINSAPTPITIHGGHPDSAHFTITSTLNIAGLVSIREAVVTAILGDKFSNIVRPGTAVSFRTSAGIIIGSAVTDTSGRASVTHTTVNPPPALARKGFVTLTAETKDEDGVSIFAIDSILWSGHTLVEMVGASTFAIADGGNVTLTVRVSDVEFGNPLEGGSTVDISASVGSVSGSAIIPDTQIQGITTTLFDFTIRDDDPGDIDPPAPSTVSILVTSPNGNVKLEISGTID
ncbi:MAG: carboxypeptidase regulatory-like domain-containing protein [Candidatus Marinimicrobia bacterium]|nr:carboxypeptidase regulatory-like domain-containing protein [Candidatus Neomarinimicrobiota bacterium]